MRVSQLPNPNVPISDGVSVNLKHQRFLGIVLLINRRTDENGGTFKFDMILDEYTVVKHRYIGWF